MKKIIMLGLLLLQLCSLPATHIAKIRPDHIILLVGQALNHRQFDQAAKLMSHFVIRTHLDAACCHDASAISAMNLLTHLEILPKYVNICTIISPEKLAAITRTSLNNIEQALTAGELASPEWIAEYCTGENKISPLFSSPAQCDKKRMHRIQELREELKKHQDSL